MTARRADTLPRHPLNPRIAGLRASVLLAHYRARLRRQLAAELLAGLGIAIGVALVFGSLLASSSITGSAPAIIRAVDGGAKLQALARSPAGIEERLAERAGRLPGVRYAVFVLREKGVLVSHDGRQDVQIVGVTPDVVTLHQGASRGLGSAAALLSGGIGLPAPLARKLGIRSGRRVSVLAAGDAHPAQVRAVLSASQLGAAAQAPIALARLNVAQRIAERPGRVDEILIEPRSGAAGRVAEELRALLGSRAEVAGVGSELRALEQTAKPLGQSTALFAAIGAIVGLLFVLNATLLTLPERRRIVAELYAQGFELRQVRAIVISQAVLLGSIASLLGLGLGLLLARTIFAQSTVYLAAAFPIAGGQRLGLGTAGIAFAGGVAAAVLAALPPMLDLLRGRAPLLATGEVGHGVQRVGRGATLGLLAAGLVLVAAVSGLVLAYPSLTILGGILLAVAVPCMIPALFAVVVRLLRSTARRTHGSTLALASIELGATATRSFALIGVAAIAVYGSVAVEGARSDLTKGLDAAVVEFLDTAPVWVAADRNFLTIDGFNARETAHAIANAPGVSGVREFAGSLLDVGARRVWIRGRPDGDAHVLQDGQLIEGEAAQAEARIRSGGWAAVSAGLAREHGLAIGDRLQLPTPTGVAPLRIAALTTNVGWAPGAVTISLSEYQRHWGSTAPTAFEVTLRPGVSAAAGASAVRSAISPRRGLIVQTASEREASFQASAREGLRTLGQISMLLLVTAALAVAAVLGASIWQRRGRLASLKAQGFDRVQLWRALVLESAIAVAIGCVDGAALGLYGHALASRWLEASTGFPAPFSVGIGGLLLAPAIVAAVTVLLVGPLGFQSARVQPIAAFQDQG